MLNVTPPHEATINFGISVADFKSASSGSTKISRDIEDFLSSIIDIDSFTLICQNVHDQGGIYPANNFRQIVQLDINEIGLRVAIVSSKITL